MSAWGIAQYDTLTASMTAWLPEWLEFLAGVIAVIAAIVAFIVFLFAFMLIANLIASPFLALLAERVEKELTGSRPTGTSNLLAIAVRALGGRSANSMYYLPRLLGIFLLTLVPVINVAAPVLWVLFGGWMMAVQYTDFAADNNEVSFRALRARLGRTRVQAIAFGLLAYLALAIPVVNLILIPGPPSLAARSSGLERLRRKLTRRSCSWVGRRIRAASSAAGQRRTAAARPCVP
ncbi:MAG: sulfate transporter CysZ [Gammaproteobacteria bacterium]|nr:sulfate transporter CysZ [Gammaproteobacteria bacterium]